MLNNSVFSFLLRLIKAQLQSNNWFMFTAKFNDS